MVSMQKWRYLPHFLSEKGFKGTAVNQTLPSVSSMGSSAIGQRVIQNISDYIKALIYK